MKDTNWAKWVVIGGISFATCIILRGAFIFYSVKSGIHPSVLEMRFLVSSPTPTLSPTPQFHYALVLRTAEYDVVRISLTILGLWLGIVIAMRLLKEPKQSFKRYRGLIWGALFIREFPMLVSVWGVNFVNEILLRISHPGSFWPGPVHYFDMPILLLTPLIGGFVFAWLSGEVSPLGGGLLAMSSLLFIPPAYDRWPPFASPFVDVMASIYAILGCAGVYLSNLSRARKTPSGV